jgi:hypothetical protein
MNHWNPALLLTCVAGVTTASSTMARDTVSSSVFAAVTQSPNSRQRPGPSPSQRIAHGQTCLPTVVGYVDSSQHWQIYYSGGSFCGVAYDPSNHQIICSYCSYPDEHTHATMKQVLDPSWEPCRVNRERTGVECTH